jgi:hypothetical protein
MTLPLADLRDASTFGPAGVGLTGQRITGARVAVEWAARAWFTPRGALTWAQGKGVNLFDLENSTHDRTGLERWRQRLIAEASEVEYVADVKVTITRADRQIRIDGEVVLVDGRSYPLAVRLAQGAAVLVTFGAAT